MSSGTTFWLLKKCRARLSNTMREKLVNDWNSQAENGSETKSLPRLLDVRNELYDFVASDTFDLYFVALEYDFNSIFTPVRNVLEDDFRMDAYKSDRRHLVIGRDLATSMLMAVNYILSEEYSTTFEDILDNRFVNALGELNPKYMEWKCSFRRKDDDDMYFEDFTSNIKRLRTILSAYLEMDDDFDEYLLVAEIWG